MSGHIKITGIDAIKAKLKRDASLTSVKQVIKQNTIEMNATAQRNAPVDSGYLRRSIAMSIENEGLSGHVNATAEYAKMVNDGTRYQAAQPFMTDAYYKQKVKLREDLFRLFRTSSKR